jgi:hypothetical protein
LAIGERLAAFRRCKMSLLMCWTAPAPDNEFP